MIRTTLVIAVAAAFLGIADGSAAPRQNPKLVGMVGPGFTITLETSTGARVTKIDPGTYDIEVKDQSDFHNFHLRGPGIDQSTGVEATTTVTWTVTFGDGTYTYFCEPHSSTLRGSFTAGTVALSPTSTPAPITPKTKLALTTGPGFTITLKTAVGKSFKTMKRGTYTIVVRDRSSDHNAHLTAPGGVNKKTGVAFKGSVTWKVKLTKVGTLRYRCDPHALEMNGSRKIV
jgi:plastocyanin